MANSEHLSPDDDFTREVEDGIAMFASYLELHRPTLLTNEKRDPFTLAQTFQADISREKGADLQLLMGSAGRQELNKIIPNNMLVHRLAILTHRLFAMIEDDEYGHAEDYNLPVLVTGLFDKFSFKEADDEKLILAELTEPVFLRPRLDRSVEEFAGTSRLLIPVGDISARLYDPFESN